MRRQVYAADEALAPPHKNRFEQLAKPFAWGAVRPRQRTSEVTD